MFIIHYIYIYIEREKEREREEKRDYKTEVMSPLTPFGIHVQVYF